MYLWTLGFCLFRKDEQKDSLKITTQKYSHNPLKKKIVDIFVNFLKIPHAIEIFNTLVMLYIFKLRKFFYNLINFELWYRVNEVSKVNMPSDFI